MIPAPRRLGIRENTTLKPCYSTSVFVRARNLCRYKKIQSCQPLLEVMSEEVTAQGPPEHLRGPQRKSNTQLDAWKARAERLILTTSLQKHS